MTTPELTRARADLRWEPMFGNPLSSIWTLIEGPIDAVRGEVVDASHHGEGWRFKVYGSGDASVCGFASRDEAMRAAEEAMTRADGGVVGVEGGAV